MTGRLTGKTALVTGAAAGIGRAVAERFSAEGAKLVLFDLDGGGLDEAAQASGAIAVEGDVTATADIARALAACDGRLDIVVNAAGVIGLDTPSAMPDAHWRRMFAVNIDGPMAVCRAALPLLIERRGAIVNVASVAAVNPSPHTSAYAASKAALVSYTRSLAHAHGVDGVRANCVAPGWVRTPMSEAEMRLAAAASGATVEEEFATLAARIALRRIATAAEIAACCLFLACDESSFVTGAVLIADGGGRSPAPLQPASASVQSRTAASATP